jgi:hypothetical protein
MPLDSTGTALLLDQSDSLKRIGIEPVPKAIVIAYKTQFRANWLRQHPMWNLGRCRWATVKQPKRHKLATFLNNPTALRNYSDDHTAAPQKLVVLAHRVLAEMPAAEFSVDYFDKDPILYVSYKNDGEGTKRRACLGIWDKGEIKHIATEI